MGEFSQKVRHGDVIGPRKRTFTLEGWKNNYETSSQIDEMDTTLYDAGKLIHAKLSAIRGVVEQSPLSSLSRETRIKAFVAATNHQFEAVQIKMRRHTIDVARDRGDGEVHVLDFANARTTLADGVSYNLANVLGTVIEGHTIPIKVALTAPANLVHDDFDAVNWRAVITEVNLGFLYKQTEDLWEDCVWNKYALLPSDNGVIATPTDPDAKQGFLAAQARKTTLDFESMIYTAQAFAVLKKNQLAPRIKEVHSVINEHDAQRIVLGRNEMDPHRQIMLYAMQTIARPPYYDSLLEDPQAVLAGASLSKLLDGWMVLSQASARLWDQTAPARERQDSEGSNTLSDMREYLPHFKEEALVAAMQNAAELSQKEAQAILKFLTFRGKDKQELWTQPLVPAGDQANLYPIFGVLVIPPSAHFLLERWMVQLNVRLDKRGHAFEQYLRSSLVRAAADSPMLSSVAKVVSQDYTFNCSDGSFGQFDALFCIGSCVFAVEAKCILEPVEPTSIGTHRTAIEGAAEQAKTRVKLIEDHRAEFIADVKQFGWSLPPDFCVYPLIAVSTVAHVGVLCRDVPVVDKHILDRFFAGGYEDGWIGGSDFSVLKRSFRSFYSNAADAESEAPVYFDEPPQLRRFNDGWEPKMANLTQVSPTDWRGILIYYEQDPVPSR